MERNLTRLHDKTHFFKYTSASTAVKIMSNCSLQWSSPLKFNDPFDHQIGFSYQFSGDDIGDAILQEMERIVFEGKDSFEDPTDLARLGMELHKVSGQLDREEVLAQFREGAQEVARNFGSHIGKLQTTLQNYLTHSRVLCVSEEVDNVVMWSHYADQHSGVAFRLECVDDFDNTLLAAKKVNYSRELPAFPELKDYVRHLTGERLIDMAALSWAIPFTKHEDWAYEREWRVYRPLLREPADTGFSLYKENPRVFGAIYLGCRISDMDAEKVIEAAGKNIPHATIYRARKSREAFELVFDEV